MGHLHHSLATLRIVGDDLDPEDISRLLAAVPTASFRKGDELVGSATGSVRAAKTGNWRFSASRQEPEDLNAQVFEILGQLSQDLSTWAVLCSRYKVDLFCGIFMASGNDGLPLTAEALSALGQRGIDLDLDIYDASDD